MIDVSDKDLDSDRALLIIADDDWQLAQLYKRLGEGCGWNVIICSNGVELVKTVRETLAPCLVLSDISMPKMDGIDAIAELRSTAQPIRVRIMTGGDASKALAAKMIAKANDIEVGHLLFKPISIHKLRKILEEEARLLKAM